MSDDFPIPVKVRMWAFLHSGKAVDIADRLDDAEQIAQFLWVDFDDDFSMFPGERVLH